MGAFAAMHGPDPAILSPSSLDLGLPMRRRKFIALLGSGVAGWPLAARAQQTGMPVIGLLDPTSRDANPDRLLGFRQGLKDTGYVEGENVAIEYRWGENQMIACLRWRLIWFAGKSQ